MWPAIQKKAQKAYDRWKHKYPVDLDAMEATALDYLIVKTRDMTRDKFSVEQLRYGMAKMVERLGQSERIRRGRQEALSLEDDVAVADEPKGEIEDLVRPLKIKLDKLGYDLLLRVLYFRDGETVRGAMTESERNHWRRNVVPVVREWAEQQGIVLKGVGH